MYLYILGSFAAISWFMEIEQVHLRLYWGQILTVVLSDPRRCRMLMAYICVTCQASSLNIKGDMYSLTML